MTLVKKNEKLEDYKRDSRYKKYVQLVEKNLQTFENITEWADLIAFLGRLLKTFQAFPQFEVIPRKLTVAKRLAQCLNPALPAGVHQKTLEVYEYIFQTIGADQLADDLALYSSGLFPFVQYAAMSVKPQLLSLFETYYFPLHTQLKPILKSLIIALLPVIEEENGEFFDRVVSLLDHLSQTITMSYFYQCMWLVMITSAQLRGPVLNYLIRRAPSMDSLEDRACFLGDDAGLMVRAFSATLGDSNILVQRSMLELLVIQFPLSKQIIKHHDLTLLMKAALGVVLRKDMSLNRRLYGWLLGPHDQNNQQQEYFSKYAREPLTIALRRLFFAAEGDLAEGQRPYKIIVSLMDRGEIGQPIVQDLIVDVLQSLRGHISKSEFGPGLLPTANMFVEMVTPYLFWMKLFNLMDENFPSSASANTLPLDLIEFVLDTFKLLEEEIQLLHMPLLLLAIVCKIEKTANHPDFNDLLPQIERALTVSIKLLRRMPENVFKEQSETFEPEIEPGQDNSDSESKLHNHSSESEVDVDKGLVNSKDTSGARFFKRGSNALEYIRDVYTPCAGGNYEFGGIRGAVLIKELLQHLQIFLRELASQKVLTCSAEEQRKVSAVMQKACTLLDGVSTHAIDSQTLVVGQDRRWLEVLLECCYRAQDFSLLNAALSLVIDLVSKKQLPSLSVWAREQVRKIMDRLWSWLSPEYISLHPRIVQLIWQLHAATHFHHIETLIAGYLVNQDTKQRLKDYECFSILVQLSENVEDLSRALARPMFLMLDTLRDDNPTNRRAGESWLRTHLKSHARLLDPIIQILQHPSICRRQTTATLDDETISFYYYEKNFNQTEVLYALETLLTICRFGGQSFLRSTRVHSASLSPGNISLDDMKAREAPHGYTSYFECMVMNALKLLESEVSESFISSMGLTNESIQITATDLLHFFATKSEFMDLALVQQAYEVTLRKLLFCISVSRLDLQTRLLFLLHATSSLLSRAERRRKNSAATADHPDEDGELATSFTLSTPMDAASSPLLIKCLINALSMPSNRPLLQHWLDFVVSCLSFWSHAFKRILLPLMQCLSDQLVRCFQDMQAHLEYGAPTCSEEDMVGLLMCFERVLLFCLVEGRIDETNASMSVGASTDSRASSLPLGISEGTGGLRSLAGYLFSADSGNDSNVQENKLQARETILYHLPTTLQILLDIWSIFEPPNQIESPSLRERVHFRIRRLLERTYKNSPADTVEAFVEMWLGENTVSLITGDSAEKHEKSSIVITVMNSIPALSPQAVIVSLLDSVRLRSPVTQSSSRSRRNILRAGKLSDISVMRFLEQYCSNTSREVVMDVWPQCLGFVKEFVANASQCKHFFPGLLRFMTIMMDKLSMGPLWEDKKVRRDAQDQYQRMLDYCILISGKSFDQGIWLRRSNYEDEQEVSSDPGVEISETAEKDQTITPNASTPDLEKRTLSSKYKEDLTIQQINLYFAQTVIGLLRRLLIDPDKINAVLSNLMYYVVTPQLKTRVTGGGKGNYLIPDMLSEISSIPFAYRTWRKEIWDTFLDNKFFVMDASGAQKWKHLIQCVMQSEKERFAELIGRISTTPSTTALFSNREQEELNRSLNLRRLSFILYCGEKDQYLPRLPSILEKLVDLFRLNQIEPAHVELYLCLRVLLMRISHHHLSNFWPTVLTELLRFFDIVLQNDTLHRPEDLRVFLAACKFLDLTFTLQIEALQIHQWIFIDDTVDSLDETPHALLDCIANKFSDSNLPATNMDVAPSPGELKRPLLTMRQVTNVRELCFFLKHISLYVHQSIFTLAPPDLTFIEELILGDLLDEESTES
ncbi:uncharacterized protein VTP21DRAFT_6332 [Calcarisporiella thermophila]|uniref:uncharacterized protein n=1 Tax=Calcarisporiella thermophila TaxID=911321 RepID=UPI003744002C